MKKLITLLFALVMTFTMANAQTVVRNGVFSNMYIGVNGGAAHSTLTTNWSPFDFNALTYNAGLELGKNVTPITGFSLEGNTLLYDNAGFGLKAMNITGNTKFNLMNLFGGYKGYPRRVEIKTVTGIGWDHSFMQNGDPNDMSLSAGLEFDFNLGKQRVWFITFAPKAIMHNVIHNNINIQPMVEHADLQADLQANLGIAYRFGSKKTGSHNFVICPNVYTEDEYQELYQMYDDCMSRPAQIDTVVVEKTVEVEKVVEVKDINTVITFEKNISKISAVEMQRLDIFMANADKDAPINVLGSADTSTGTEAYNKELALARAEAVKKVLEANGFTNVNVTTTLDAYNTVELSRSATVTCE